MGALLSNTETPAGSGALMSKERFRGIVDDTRFTPHEEGPLSVRVGNDDASVLLYFNPPIAPGTGVGELEDLPAPMCAMGARQDRLYIVEGTWRTFVGNSRDEDGEFDVSQARVVFFDSAASASQALTTAQELVFEGFPQADEAVSFFWL